MKKFLFIFLLTFFGFTNTFASEEENRLKELGQPLLGSSEKDESIENQIRNCSFRVGIWARNDEYQYCKCLYETKDFKSCLDAFNEALKEERLNPERCVERSRTHHDYEKEYDFKKYCECQTDYYKNSETFKNPEDIANKCREGKIFYID